MSNEDLEQLKRFVQTHRHRGQVFFDEKYWNEAIAEYKKVVKYQSYIAEAEVDVLDHVNGMCMFHLAVAKLSLYAGYFHDAFKHLELAMIDQAHLTMLISQAPYRYDAYQILYAARFNLIATVAMDLFTHMPQPPAAAIDRFAVSLNTLCANFAKMRLLSKYPIAPLHHIDELRQLISNARETAAVQVHKKSDPNQFFFNRDDMKATETGHHYNLRPR